MTGYLKNQLRKRKRWSSTARSCTAFILICAFLLPVVTTPARAANFEVASYPTAPGFVSSIIHLGAELLKSLWGERAAQPANQQNQGLPGPGQATPNKRPAPPPNAAELKTRVAGIAVNPADDATLQLGQPVNLAAVPLDRDGNTVQGLAAEWESSNPEIVSITQDGQAVAKRTGAARLTVSAGNRHESVRVIVVEGRGKFGGKKPDSRRDGNRISGNSRRSAPLASKPESVSTPGDLTELAHARVRLTLPSPMLPADQDPLPDDETSSLYQPINVVGNPIGVREPPSAPPSPSIGSTEMPGSSNFSFGVPLLNLPGRGLNVSLDLVYNSRVWNRSTDAFNHIYMTYDVDNGWPAPGFKMGYGQMEDQGSAGFTLTDPDGTRHPMRSCANGDPNCYESTDSTFIVFEGGQGWGTATYSDGTHVDFGAAGTGPRSYPTKITDRTGNYILINYRGGVGPQISSVKDTMNRYVRFYYEGDDLIAVTAPEYNSVSDRQVVRFYYDNLTVNPAGGNCFAPGTQSSISGDSRTIRYVYFPATRAGYRYDYNSPYGVMTGITRLLQMTVSYTGLDQSGAVTSNGQSEATTYYNYPATAQSLTDAPTFSSRTDDWIGRTTASAPVYQYSVDQAAGVDTVTAPDGTVAETHKVVAPGAWNDGFISDVMLKAGSAVLSATHTDWVASSEDSNAINPRVTQMRIINDVGQTRVIKFDYASYEPQTQNYNNVLKIREFDLTTDGSLGAELRRTETDYETGTQYTGRGLKHLPTAQRVVVNGVVVSRVAYAYDESSLTQRAGISMYDDPGTPYRGNLTSLTVYANASASTGATTNAMLYDVAGNLTSETVNCCNLKTFTYTSTYQFAYPESVTSGSTAQLTTSMGYDYNTGLLRSTTDENNQATIEDYNIDSYPNWHMTTRADGGFSKQIYYAQAMEDPDAQHSHTFVYTQDYLGGDQSAETSYYHTWRFMDGRGALARTFTKTGAHGTSEGYVVTDIEYEQMGRLSRRSNPYYASLGAQQPIKPDNSWTTVVQYDGLSRPRVVELQDGTTVRTSYSAQSTPYVGVATTITDEAGKSRRQVVDALGRVRTLVEPDASGNLDTAQSPVTTYEYDGMDNLTQITQGEQVRKFKYDSLGRLTHQKQVEATATLDDNGSYVGAATGLWTTVTQYNAQGHITDGYDARGVHTHFSLDGLNRITGVTYSDGTPAVTYTYDEAHAGYYNNGRLTRVTTAAASGIPQTVQSFDYDRMGRVSSHRQSIGADTYTLGYGYNLAGQLVNETYPSGKTISYGYDSALRLQSVGDSTRTYLSGISYAAHGGVLTESLGNGTSESYTYNSRIQLSRITLTKQGQELQRYDYKYGRIDLISGEVDETKNNGQIGRIEGYIGGVKQWQERLSYDSTGRLSTAQEVRWDNGVQAWRVDYSYDRYGNRYQSANQTSAVPYVPILNTDISTATNRLTNQTEYDDSGNVTADYKFKSLQYRYDANNRMKRVLNSDGQITQSSAVYDGLGQRVQTTESGATKNLVYDVFGRLVAEYGGQSQYGDAGGLKYMMMDHQGSTRVLMNSRGEVVARRDYQPFGEEIPSGIGLRTNSQGYGASEGSRQRYADLERDKSGLDHTDWRKYDSESGRWTSLDPLAGSIDDPQSLNRYSYTENDPVNLVDPNGLSDGPPTGGHGEDPNHNGEIRCPAGQTAVSGYCLPIMGGVTINGGSDWIDFPTLPGFGHAMFLPMLREEHLGVGLLPTFELNHPQQQKQYKSFKECEEDKEKDLSDDQKAAWNDFLGGVIKTEIYARGTLGGTYYITKDIKASAAAALGVWILGHVDNLLSYNKALSAATREYIRAVKSCIDYATPEEREQWKRSQQEFQKVIDKWRKLYNLSPLSLH